MSYLFLCLSVCRSPQENCYLCCPLDALTFWVKLNKKYILNSMYFNIFQNGGLSLPLVIAIFLQHKWEWQQKHPS